MSRDPIDRNALRLEVRRFVTRCEGQVALIERADSLREVARLASISLPYALAEDYDARDARRLVETRAEDRARELIQEQLHQLVKAGPEEMEKHKRAMLDTWANLTGALGHLRPWAMARLAAAEQALKG